MHFHLVTLLPDMFSALNYGITGRAQQAGILKLSFWNPRDYTKNKQGRVDDKPYGGGPGMIMQVQPLRDSLAAAKKACLPQKPKIIYLSPQGKLLTQKQIQLLRLSDTFILIAGRYEGIDERVIQQDIDEEWSIGNYILSGGEIPAMVLIDALTRLHPNALGNPLSAQQESFTHYLLDYPHYTRPAEIDHQKVPSALLEGDHEKIRRFRLQQSLAQTYLKKPRLLKKLIENHRLSPEEQLLLQNFIEQLKMRTK